MGRNRKRLTTSVYEYPVAWPFEKLPLQKSAQGMRIKRVLRRECVTLLTDMAISSPHFLGTWRRRVPPGAPNGVFLKVLPCMNISDSGSPTKVIIGKVR